MSSDDGIEYQKSLEQQQHHHHHHQLSTGTAAPQPFSLALSTGSAALHQHHQSNNSPAVAANTIERRRKSSLSYQHQLQQVNNNSCELGVIGIGPASCTIDHGPATPNATSNYANLASPNRYGSSGGAHHHHAPPPPETYHHIGGRLSIHPIDRYDDNLATCCLPPPSPAPTSDRYVMGIPSPSPAGSQQQSQQQQHHHHHYQPDQTSASSQTVCVPTSGKYAATTINRTMSPSSRYRLSTSDRYRDVSPKCDRFVTATHFLANSTPLVSSDTYAYLSSTVHTPVKRYVPTPPPSSEIYSELAQQSASSAAASSSSSSSGGGYHTIANSPHLPQPVLTSAGQQPHPGVNTLPYRFRMKCCAAAAADQSGGGGGAPSSLPLQDRASVSDHYATPPRIRPMKCLSTGSVSNQQLSVAAASPSLGVRQSRTACVVNDYMPRTPSVEYLGSAGGRVVTPVSAMSEPSGGGTCLHCNTIRRTTGVHQTTQTTGPISPVPQQQQQNLPLSSSTSGIGSIIDSRSSGGEQLMGSTASPTLSTNQSQMSPLSPQQQQHNSNMVDYSGVQQQQQSQSAILSSHASLLGRTTVQTTTQHQSQPQPPHLAQPQFAQQHHHPTTTSSTNSSTNNLLSTTPQRNTLTIRQQMQRFSRKQRLREYVRREIAKFFGVDIQTEDDERAKWSERQKRLALRRFGPFNPELNPAGRIGPGRHHRRIDGGMYPQPAPLAGDRPDILPAQTTDESSQVHHYAHRGGSSSAGGGYEVDSYDRIPIEKKASVPTMIVSGLSYIIQTLNKRQHRQHKQWSRSFASAHVTAINGDNPGDMCEGLTALQEDEVFFDTPGNDLGNMNENGGGNSMANHQQQNLHRQIYMGERVHGWRTSSDHQQNHAHHQQQQTAAGCVVSNGVSNAVAGLMGIQQRIGYRGTRISSQLLDGVLDNSRRPLARKVKLFHAHELDDRNDHRPFFTYWINTVQILVLALSLICYGVGPIGIGVEQKSGQVLVTSLSLQTVQHQEQRNVWIGPRGHDLVHLGAKFAACMRRDVKIMDVISKTRRQERETACCIRNDDSGCVQSSQADCSVRGLWPTKSISTWKKWSPGESGPGGRISGSVCGLDPKYCDAPASIAPYEWPDDITKWPICRKTNSFSQRFRFKDHTAEHMVCEVIGHPCCTGVFGECRITTREYCDFVNGYFHEEASLCSQVSCLNNVCGMFPFLSAEVPDQFYRLFTSLCLHAGVLHLAITVAFQHIFLADLERLIGPIRTAIVYIGSGLAGNLTSAILVPYKPEVGPLASLAGVISSLVILLLLIHWKQLKKPHLALMKLIVLAGTLFGMGTLPWQQNFAGLIAGVMCGILLTIALVPFVSVTKYARKSKINLIWTCMVFHLFMYGIMFVIFYIFPTEFTSFSFGDVLNNGMGTTTTSGGVGGFDTTMMGGSGGGNTIHQQQHHHHHHGEDIAMNGGVLPPSSDHGGATFSATYGNVQPQQSQQHHRILSANNLNNGAANSIVTCDKGSCTTAVATDNANILGSTETLNNNLIKNNQIDDVVVDDAAGEKIGGAIGGAEAVVAGADIGSVNLHSLQTVRNGAAAASNTREIADTLNVRNVLNSNHRSVTA